jgi:hypothetical protein
MDKLIVLLGILFLSQSCRDTTNEASSQLPDTVDAKGSPVPDPVPDAFKSILRPNANLKPGVVYTDTVTYVGFDDTRDNGAVRVEKNKDTVDLICDDEPSGFRPGDLLEIRWKLDSIRDAGDPDYLSFRECLITAKPLQSASSAGNSGNRHAQSFVVSCGSGCAMTHNVRKISRLHSKAIEVTFSIDLYTDENLTESFEETYTFYYTDARALEKIIREGESGNAMETFTPSAKSAFEDFSTQLVQ